MAKITKEYQWLKPSEITDILVEVIIHNYLLPPGSSDSRTIVPMVWGSPGTGKTSVVKAATRIAAEKLSEMLDKHVELPCVVEPIADKSPEEITGYPRPDSDSTFRRLMPRKWYDVKEGPCVGFLDEIAQGNVEQQNVARGALLGQQIGELRLAHGSTVVAASNLSSDRAGTHVMPTHVRDVLMHLYLKPDHKDWTYWAAQAGISPEITSFIYVHGAQYLHNLETDASAMACPSPRSYEKLDQVWKMKLPPGLKSAMINGTIGDSAGQAFLTHTKLQEAMPDIDAVCAGKPVKMSEAKSDVLYMTMCALASRWDRTNSENIAKFLNSLKSKEFGSFCVQMAIRRDKTLRSTPGARGWLLDKEVDLMF